MADYTCDRAGLSRPISGSGNNEQWKSLVGGIVYFIAVLLLFDEVKDLESHRQFSCNPYTGQPCHSPDKVDMAGIIGFGFGGNIFLTKTGYDIYLAVYHLDHSIDINWT